MIVTARIIGLVMDAYHDHLVSDYNKRGRVSYENNNEIDPQRPACLPEFFSSING